MANPQPDEFTRISNELFEAIMFSNFMKRQRNILDLIIRLSYGCGKKFALLKKSDFEIVGVYKTHIKKELDYLEAAKVIRIAGNQISINKNYDEWRINLVYDINREKYKKILSKNLPQKVTKMVTDEEGKVTKTVTRRLPKRELLGYQNGNLKVTKTVTEQALETNGDIGSETCKETLKKHKEILKKYICVYDHDFEKFWTEYPRKAEKQRAYRCWKIRIKEGLKEGLSEGLTMEGLVWDLVDAAKNYAADCRKRRIEEQYIKHASTFLGPDRPYLDWISRAEIKQEEKEKEAKKGLIKSLYLN
jgi:hypothetical protein